MEERKRRGVVFLGTRRSIAGSRGNVRQFRYFLYRLLLTSTTTKSLYTTISTHSTTIYIYIYNSLEYIYGIECIEYIYYIEYTIDCIEYIECVCGVYRRIDSIDVYGLSKSIVYLKPFFAAAL